MPNRETWDWKALEPDKTVTMVMLFDRNSTIIKDGEKIKINNDGRKEGTDYDWHSYVVTVDGKDWTMFTPSEFMHSALQALGVEKKGDIFRATKRLGYNIDTGKSYTYYELERDGTRLRTNQMDNQPTETPQQQVEKVIKETATEVDFREMHRPAFRAVMDNIMEYLEEWCPTAFENKESAEVQQSITKLILQILPHIGSQVNTLVLQNGGKKG